MPQMFQLRFVLCSLLLISACQSTRRSSFVKDTQKLDPADIKPLTCSTGEPYAFKLQPTKDATKADFDLPRSFDTSGVGLSEELMRIDFCLVDEEPLLKRIVLVFLESAEVIDVDSHATIEGFKEVLFEQDYKKLKIIVPYGKQERWGEVKDTGDVLYILGSQTKSAAIVAPMDETFEVRKDRLVDYARIGTFEYGSASTSCADIAQVKGKFTLGTATFEWMGMAGTGTSGGAIGSPCSISVTDSSPELGAHAGKTVKVEIGFEDSEQFKLVKTHHKVCDQFVLKTEHATYAAMARGTQDSSIADCSRRLPEIRDYGYFFRYGTKVVEGTFTPPNPFDESEPLTGTANPFKAKRK